MTHSVRCLRCFQENGTVVKTRVLVSSTALTRWKCRAKGHINRSWVQNPFYELLFRRAIGDLSTLDYREAVLNFYSAYETFLRTTLLLLRTALHVKRSRSLKRMKMPDVREELKTRYKKHTGLALALLAKSTEKIRHEVAHDDAVPTRAQVVKLGEAVRVFINSSVLALQPLHWDYATGTASAARTVAAHKKLPAKPEDLQGPPYLSPTSILVGVDFSRSVGRQARTFIHI